jgi:D-threo-aldose 1-dehydrogenase
MRQRQLGSNGPQVSVVCVGGSPLGGMPATYGYDVDRERGVQTVSAFLRSGMNFIDTSNEYSDGESERRIGEALRRADRPRDDLVIATKADPERGATTFDARRVRESFEESRSRLGVSTFSVYWLHDPERFPIEHLLARGGALEGMLQLKEEHHVGVIGVAGGSIEMMHRFLDTGSLDLLLCHSRFNLLDRSANALIDHTIDAGVAFVNAAPYGSGMLAKPVSAGARFQYRPPSEDIREKAKWLHEECDRFGVPLAAVALQFSTHDPRISSTVVGVSSAQRVTELEVNEEWEIPDDLWDSIRNRMDDWAPLGGSSS